jgi:hypothetical protein
MYIPKCALYYLCLNNINIYIYVLYISYMYIDVCIYDYALLHHLYSLLNHLWECTFYFSLIYAIGNEYNGVVWCVVTLNCIYNLLTEVYYSIFIKTFLLPIWSVLNHMVYFMCRNSCFYRTKRKWLIKFYSWKKIFFWIWLLSHAKLILNVGGWIDLPMECVHRLTSLINIIINVNNSKTVIFLLMFVFLRRVLYRYWCFVSLWDQLS